MKYWQMFEFFNQFLLSNMIYYNDQKDLKKESVSCHHRLFEDLVCRVIQPDYFFEIGAHEASTSVKVKRKLPQCGVYAFEADIDVFEYYKKKVGRTIEYRNEAVANFSGALTFYKQIQPNGELFLNNSIKTKSSVEYSEYKVNAVTVDDLFCSMAPGSVVLRIDVEGNTYEVLSGARDTLKNVKAIYAEVEDYEIWSGQKTAFAVHELLDEAGFVPVSRDVETPGQYNVFWLPQALAQDRRFRARLTLYYNELKKLDRIAGERNEI